MGDDETITLAPWTGPWQPDDPDANYKHEIALYSPHDPMPTLTALAGAISVPVGAIARFVLVRYTTAGSSGLLEIGPTMVHRLWEAVDQAETAGTDEARLGAYRQLKDMLSWLRLPLVEDAGYPPSA